MLDGDECVGVDVGVGVAVAVVRPAAVRLEGLVVGVAGAVAVAVVRRAAVILEVHVVRVGGAGAARAAGAGSAAAEVGVPVRVARGPVDLGVMRGSVRPPKMNAEQRKYMKSNCMNSIKLVEKEFPAESQIHTNAVVRVLSNVKLRWTGRIAMKTGRVYEMQLQEPLSVHFIESARCPMLCSGKYNPETICCRLEDVEIFYSEENPT